MVSLRTGIWCALLLLSLGVPLAANAGSLRDFDGRERSLSEFTGSGRWLVVMIWASDCHVCNSEVYQYVDFHDMHHDRDAEVVGISLDGQAGRSDAAAFLERHSVSFPSLIGEPEQVARLYTELTGDRFVGTPSFLVFAPSGELRARQAGAVPTSIIEQFIRQQIAGPGAPRP